MTPLTSLWDLSLFFHELRCVNILVGWKMEVRQTFLAGPLMCVALRRQRSQVRILSGAPDFNDLANGIGHHLLSRKHHGSTRREVIGQFVALLSTREPKEPSPS